MAEEEAKAAMMPILRFDSINDEEKDIMRQKEQDLQRLLEEQRIWHRSNWRLLRSRSRS